MQSLTDSIECYKKMWQLPTPNNLNNFQALSESQTLAKTAREAEKIFSQVALTSFIVAAFAFKFLIAPIWLPTFLFAGITALACFTLSLFFQHFVYKFEKWKELPQEKIQEIIFNHLMHALKTTDAEEFKKICKEINDVVGNEVVTVNKNDDDTLCLSFESTNFSLTQQQKLDFLWEANRRHVLLAKSNEDQFFVLDYIDYINRLIEKYPNILDHLPIDYFHLQFKRFTIIEGQKVWGVKLTDNKQKVNFVVNYFPAERLAETCKMLKENISVELFIHPDNNKDQWIAFAKTHDIVFHEIGYNFSLANQS